MSLDSDSVPSSESEGDAVASNGTHDWGGNGSGPVVAEAEAPTAEAKAPVGEAPVATDETTDETTGETTDETMVAAAADAPAPATDAPTADDGSAFLAELTRAMQATAGAERERAIAEIERRREQHLAAIEARRVANADEIRALASTDLAAIDAWADGERTRIASEHETRAAALRDDLERSLAEHGSRIDREIAGVEAAIAAHRTEVDAFFSSFDHETDPVVIAQNAGRRPTFPALDSIAGEGDATTTTDSPATADAAPVSTGVGVMNPAPRTGLADAWAAWSDSQEQTISTGGETASAEVAPVAGEVADPASGPETLDVFAVTSSSAKAPTSNLIQSMPINRPLGWLRRGPANDDSTKGS